MPSRSNDGLKRFIIKAVLVLLPVFAIFMVLDIVAIGAGELIPVKRVIRTQAENNNGIVLYGRKVVDQELRRYKYEQYLERRSDIIALGSSRILSMREEFFSPYYSFTNVGSIAHGLGDVKDFVGRLATSSLTRYVFLSLDHYWFGQKRTLESGLTKDLEALNVSYDWRAHIFASRYILSAFFRDNREVLEYFDDENPFRRSFGFQGRNGDGYRVDGSYLYTTFLEELRKDNVYRDREQPSIIDRVRSGSGSYAFDSDFDTERLVILGNILKELKSKNYHVIGLGLPFSSEVYKELLKNEHHRDLFAEYRDKVPGVFVDNGFKYFDYSDLNKIGLNDSYMFDGVHPSETASAIILIDVLGRLNSKEFIGGNQIASRLGRMVASSKTFSFELDLEPIAD